MPIGNQIIHLVTSDKPQTLRVDLEDHEAAKAYAKYGTFRVGSEYEKFPLTVGSYSGTAGIITLDKINTCTTSV